MFLVVGLLMIATMMSSIPASAGPLGQEWCSGFFAGEFDAYAAYWTEGANGGNQVGRVFYEAQKVERNTVSENGQETYKGYWEVVALCHLLEKIEEAIEDARPEQTFFILDEHLDLTRVL